MMDVDAEGMQRAYPLISYFELSPQLFPWRDSRQREIAVRRAEMSDSLIFDVLLVSGGVKEPDILYPPQDGESLQRLLNAIDNSKYDALKKDCLVYFLLKWHQDGREIRFMEERCIPPQFAALADAYWHLDAGINLALAVSILSDSRLNRDYSSKIIQALLHSPNPTPLIIKYVRTAKPGLTEPDDIDAYATALLESSLLEVWQFQRTFSENDPTRQGLIRKILESYLSPVPRSKPLAQLLAFPFSSYEESLFHSYALQPPSSCPPASVSVIRNLACVRLVQAGQYASAIKLDHQFASLEPANLASSAQKVTQDRRKLMDEVLTALPAVERTVLESELERLAQGKSLSVGSSSGSGESFVSIGEVDDLSMSWEDIRAPQINGFSKRAKSPPQEVQSFPIISISERSATSRFGGPLSVPSSNPHALPNLSASTSTARNLFSTPPLVAITSPQPTSKPNNSSPFQFASSSTAIRSGPKIPPVHSPPHSVPSTLPSLFNPLGASANRGQNAFSHLTSQTNGVKRSFEQEGPRDSHLSTQAPQVSSFRVDEAEDVDMDSEDEIVRQVKRRPNGKSREDKDQGDESLEYSLFGNSALLPDVSAAPANSERQDTGPRMPPGAFMDDESEEDEELRERVIKIPYAPRAKQTRTPRGQKQVTHKSSTALGRSLPGSLMDEDDQDAHEDNEEMEGNDHVAPLPSASKRPPRKARSSRASSVGADEDHEEQPEAPRRRSSRLSSAHSEPEPPAKKPGPIKPKKTASAAASSKTERAKKRR